MKYLHSSKKKSDLDTVLQFYIVFYIVLQFKTLGSSIPLLNLFSARL